MRFGDEVVVGGKVDGWGDSMAGWRDGDVAENVQSSAVIAGAVAVMG